MVWGYKRMKISYIGKGMTKIELPWSTSLGAWKTWYLYNKKKDTKINEYLTKYKKLTLAEDMETKRMIKNKLISMESSTQKYNDFG